MKKFRSVRHSFVPVSDNNVNRDGNLYYVYCNIKRGTHKHQTPPRYRNAVSHASPYGPLRPNLTSSMKPEVYNVSQRHQRRTEPRPQGISTTSFVKIGPAVSEICSRTDRHTDRRKDTQTDKQTDRNTPLPYRGGVVTIFVDYFTVIIPTVETLPSSTSRRCCYYTNTTSDNASHGLGAKPPKCRLVPAHCETYWSKNTWCIVRNF